MPNFKSNTRQKFFLRQALAIALSTSLVAIYAPAGLTADDLNFKIYSPETTGAPEEQASPDTPPPASQAGINPDEISDQPKTDSAAQQANKPTATLSDEKPVADATPPTSDTDTTTKEKETATKPSNNPDDISQPKTEQAENKTADETANSDSTDKGKLLKGYVSVVPTGTKIPIIMDTAVDSDTSQEGDEFSARTSEDLTIDGSTVVPAGSIIRGRIATINAPKHLDRNGSVALKFDTITTPDNRQIPLVANLVAHGGVVHARRGVKDIAMDTGVALLPAAVGIGIGAVAGNSGNSKIGVGGGALIGAGIGAAVGVAILLAKKGKKVDVRPGDELKIELAEDLHMPTM